MRNYSIIEDLVQNHCENLVSKNHSDTLSDCLIRNFALIRRHSQLQDELFLGKFKKKIIPRYVQQFNQFCQTFQSKSRQTFYFKTRIWYENSILRKKDRQFQAEINNDVLKNQRICIQHNLNEQNDKNRPVQQVLLDQNNLNKNNKSFFQNLNANNNFFVNQRIRSTNKPFFHIQQKLKMTQAEMTQKDVNDNNSNASLYNDSINFSKKNIFKTSFNSMCRIRQQSKQFQQHDLSPIRNTYADEKTLERKMMSLIKRRKSTRILRIKLFSKRDTKKNIFDQNDKENFSKQINQFITVSPDKKNQTLNLGLKGKVCLPLKHRVSASCIFEKQAYLGEKYQNDNLQSIDQNKNKSEKTNILMKLNQKLFWMDEKRQSVGSVGISRVLQNSSKKFVLPKFL